MTFRSGPRRAVLLLLLLLKAILFLLIFANSSRLLVAWENLKTLDNLQLARKVGVGLKAPGKVITRNNHKIQLTVVLPY